MLFNIIIEVGLRSEFCDSRYVKFPEVTLIANKSTSPVELAIVLQTNKCVPAEFTQLDEKDSE
jgi:hypothetical protein